MNKQTLITGFPRIGAKRELKKALESYWAGQSTKTELQQVAAELRKKQWLFQKEQGIDLISCNDFSLYDNMLDTIVMLNAIPERFQTISDPVERYFAMARGCSTAVALEMTKWFNTNYHYLVPELNDQLEFSLNATKIIAEYQEAKRLGITPKINLIGPLTFLGLAKTAEGADTYQYFEKVLGVYQELMQELAQLDELVYVQIEEPLFVKNPNQKQLDLLEKAYQQLAGVSGRIRLIVTTYFEHSSEATAVLAKTPAWGIGLDFIYGPQNMASLDLIKDKKLVAGVVDGKNIWRNDDEAALSLLHEISQKVNKEQIIIATSCSLLHVPYGLANEPESEIKKWLSFAEEKVAEVVLLKKLFHAEQLSLEDEAEKNQNRMVLAAKKDSQLINNKEFLQKMKGITQIEREGTFTERSALQKRLFKLPQLPTTTIGSFPQTREIRRLRSAFKQKLIANEEYEAGIKKYIDDCVAFQEEIGLDVLVHGEPERNDMVEYFGEMLQGFHFTTNGWVQSYGSRCVKPPIIYGDISRPAPMTVQWITYAQKITEKIMKGMLTGPVTILNWSFVRNDKPRAEVSRQIAVALSEEITDLQAAGIKIIQVDEAAFKEGYPLREEDITAYERWAVANFKLAVSTADKETQIHTHMCYSEFNDIIKTIEAMDADVITIETARSGNEILQIFQEIGYQNEVGPGVYDIHSPRVPTVTELVEQITALTQVLPREQLWINPDCGLKTRKWDEVKPALQNMMLAVTKVRAIKTQVLV